MPTRRALLRGLATGGAAALGLSATGTAAAASNYDVPADVTLSYDPAVLDRYKPALVTRHLQIEPNAWYGWTATSPDHDTDAHCLICRYSGQAGVVPAGNLLSDSHRYDHEPVLIFTDSDTGDLVSITPSVYHWLAESFPRNALPLVGERPALAAARPWHHYQPDPSRTGTTEIELRSLGDHLDAWLANGFEIYRPALTDPWVMQGTTGRGHFWRSWDAGFGFSLPATLWSGFRGLGWYVGNYGGTQ